MVEAVLRCLGIEPHVRLTGLAKCPFSLRTSSSYDERKLIDGLRPMSGLANKALVLGIGDRMDGDKELVQVDPMGGFLVNVRFVRPHNKITRGDECELR